MNTCLVPGTMRAPLRLGYLILTTAQWGTYKVMKQESQDANPGLSDSRDEIFSWIHKAAWLIYLKGYLNGRVLQLLSLRLNIKVPKYGKPMVFIPGSCKLFFKWFIRVSWLINECVFWDISEISVLTKSFIVSWLENMEEKKIRLQRNLSWACLLRIWISSFQ